MKILSQFILSFMIFLLLTSSPLRAERLGTDGFVYMPTWIYEITKPDKYSGEPTQESSTFNELTLRLPGTGTGCVVLPYNSDRGPVFTRSVVCEDGTKMLFTCDGSADKTGDNEGLTCVQSVPKKFALKLVVRKYLSSEENEKKEAEFEKNHKHTY